MGYMHIDNLRFVLRRALDKLFLNRIIKKVTKADERKLEYILLSNKQITRLRTIDIFSDSINFQGVNKYYVLHGEVGKVYGKRVLIK